MIFSSMVLRYRGLVLCLICCLSKVPLCDARLKLSNKHTVHSECSQRLQEEFLEKMQSASKLVAQGHNKQARTTYSDALTLAKKLSAGHRALVYVKISTLYQHAVGSDIQALQFLHKAEGGLQKSCPDNSERALALVDLIQIYESVSDLTKVNKYSVALNNLRRRRNNGRVSSSAN